MCTWSVISSSQNYIRSHLGWPTRKCNHLRAWLFTSNAKSKDYRRSAKSISFLPSTQKRKSGSSCSVLLKQSVIKTQERALSFLWMKKTFLCISIENEWRCIQAEHPITEMISLQFIQVIRTIKIVAEVTITIYTRGYYFKGHDYQFCFKCWKSICCFRPSRWK